MGGGPDNLAWVAFCFLMIFTTERVLSTTEIANSSIKFAAEEIYTKSSITSSSNDTQTQSFDDALLYVRAIDESTLGAILYSSKLLPTKNNHPRKVFESN